MKMSNSGSKKNTSEKMEFKKEMMEKVCRNNEIRGIELDILFEEYTLEVLKHAYLQLKDAADRDKVTISILAYRRNCEWSEEKLSKRKENVKRKAKKADVEDLVEQFPEYEEGIREAADDFIAKDTIYNYIANWEEDKKIQVKTEKATELWERLPITDKKEFIKRLANLVDDTTYASIFAATKLFFDTKVPRPEDPDRYAFYMTLRNYFAVNLGQYKNKAGSMPIEFNDYEYFKTLRR